MVLQRVVSIDSASDLLCLGLMEKISNLAMTPLDEQNGSRPLTAYGLDSICAIEMRNWVKRDLGAMLGLQDLLYSASIKNLSRKIATTSELQEKFSAEK